jgi:DNA polymerase-3 subunit delta'
MWKDIIGHTYEIETLRSHILSGKVDHAYLFAGIKGLGKTLVATEFFKALNCQRSPGDPCGQCASCIKTASGNHPDLIKIGLKEGKKIIPIDEIRDVIGDIVLKPFEAKVRVVIIEPAEMMNRQSANAILKTLEEPPEATIFILISHNPSLLIPTIISRCQRIRFTPIDPATLEKTLETIDPFLVRLSSGSIGVATSSDATFIQECKKGIIDLFRGQDPFSIASDIASAAKENSDLIPILLSIIESVVRDIMVMKDGGEILISKELYDIPFRHIPYHDIDQVLGCLNGIRTGASENINLKMALSELFLMFSHFVSP